MTGALATARDRRLLVGCNVRSSDGLIRRTIADPVTTLCSADTPPRSASETRQVCNLYCPDVVFFGKETDNVTPQPDEDHDGGSVGSSSAEYYLIIKVHGAANMSCCAFT